MKPTEKHVNFTKSDRMELGDENFDVISDPEMEVNEYQSMKDSDREVIGYSTVVNGKEMIIEVNENEQRNLSQSNHSTSDGYQVKNHSNKRLHKNRPQSTETEKNPTESDVVELLNVTHGDTLDNSHESVSIPEIISQSDESDNISREEFFNQVVLSFVQRYVNEAKAKGYNISDENASSVDKDMEDDFVTKLNEYLDNFVDGRDTIQFVDTSKDALTEDEGIDTNRDTLTEDEGIDTNRDTLTEDEGIDTNKDTLTEDERIYNAETNEYIKDILQSSEENYLFKKDENEMYIISKRGCVEHTEDAPNVDKVAVYQISADDIAEKVGIDENKQNVCLITDLLPNTGFLAPESLENLPVIIQNVKGKEKMYAILSTHDEDNDRSRVLCAEIKRSKIKLKKLKIFLVKRKDGHEEFYKVDLLKKQKKISARKANEAEIKKNKKSQEKNRLRILEFFFDSSEYKNKLKEKGLLSLKEQFDFSNLADYFIEEQISNLCYNAKRAAKFEYFCEEEYDPEDYEFHAEKEFLCIHHEEKKCGEHKKKIGFTGLHKTNDSKIYLNHFIKRKERRAKAPPQPALKIVIPEREKVGPLKKPKKKSELKQVLQDLEKKELLSELGISVGVFSEGKGLISRDRNMKNKNNKQKVVSKHESMPKKRESTNSANQNLSQMRKSKLIKIIEKVRERKRKLLPVRNCSTKRTKMSKNNKSRQKEDTLVKNTKVLLKSEKQSKEKIKKDPRKRSTKCFEEKNYYSVISNTGNKILLKIRREKPNQPNLTNQTTVKGQKKRKAVKMANQGEEALNLKERGIGQQSEQPNTTVKGRKKRKAFEMAELGEEALTKIIIGQPSKKPKTTVKGRKKRKAVERAKQSEQPKSTVKGPKNRKACKEVKQREEDFLKEIGGTSERVYLKRQRMKENILGQHSIF